MLKQLANSLFSMSDVQITSALKEGGLRCKGNTKVNCLELHETVAGLHKIGVIANKEMREYDQMRLAQEGELAAQPVKNTNPVHEDLVSSVSSF